jgi:hypothetical protein
VLQVYRTQRQPHFGEGSTFLAELDPWLSALGHKFGDVF